MTSGCSSKLLAEVSSRSDKDITSLPRHNPTHTGTYKLDGTTLLKHLLARVSTHHESIHRLISHAISAKAHFHHHHSTRSSIDAHIDSTIPSVDSIHTTAPSSSYRPSDRLDPSSQMKENTSLPQHIPPYRLDSIHTTAPSSLGLRV